MFRRSFLLVPLTLSAILSGCATPRPTWAPLPYNEAEYAPFLVQGTGTIKGQVFAKTRGGDVKKAAGENVYLMPATSFGDQRYQYGFLRGMGASQDPDPRHGKAVITKAADGDGKFEFSKVAPGKYYIFSTITWEVPSTVLRGVMETQGGLVVRAIEVKNNETTEAMLSR